VKPLVLLAVGQTKNKAFATLEADYSEKIARYVRFESVIIKDAQDKDPKLKAKKECEALLPKLKSGDCVIVCDERGKSFSSVEFSKKIALWQETGKRLVFVIGGAFGLTDEFRKTASTLLRLTDFTLPHELARIVLLEQVYRGFSLLAGEKYHHN